MNIPAILIDQIKDGRVLLFLGSGAAIGALHKSHIKPPVGDELSRLIADQFLGSEFYNRPLTSSIHPYSWDSCRNHGSHRVVWLVSCFGHNSILLALHNLYYRYCYWRCQ